ncbi:TetR/AcrR family transcriptional regulator C-terminal domain-containing protein [Streptomyces sp. 71268]|nr:TetR/AcrR family transcriptional regulator C-terminal domain-containing protein [Streptomyces sp. 71268]WEV30080.1 TetR/AcrR family transcriptional regulator C-terminal domain-containing protein [Streptomyces sp. 71268]
MVEAAHEIILSDGAEHLTMRRLASALRSTPMAVYHHVRDKDELLVLVLEHVARSLPRPELPEEPRERLLAACTLMYRAFMDNPWVVPIVARGELVGVSAVWMTEEIMAALVALGLDDQHAYRTHQTIWYFTAGQVVSAAPRPGAVDVATGQAGEPAPHYIDVAMASRDPADFPNLARLVGRSHHWEAEYRYEDGLSHILDGALPRSGQAGGATP